MSTLLVYHKNRDADRRPEDGTPVSLAEVLCRREWAPEAHVCVFSGGIFRGSFSPDPKVVGWWRLRGSTEDGTLARTASSAIRRLGGDPETA